MRRVETGGVLERIDRIERRWEGAPERWMERDVDMREFIDAITLRHVSVTQEAIGALQLLQGEIADQRDEIKASTQATLRLLDERFGPDPPQG
jgi:hypothetical protein